MPCSSSSIPAIYDCPVGQSLKNEIKTYVVSQNDKKEPGWDDLSQRPQISIWRLLLLSKQAAREDNLSIR
ncbi:MAG: hypothetical protein ACJ71R_16885 [Nitrososphaeraceae archaeon]